MTPNSAAVPRSGWSSASAIGTAIMISGGNSHKGLDTCSGGSHW